MIAQFVENLLFSPVFSSILQFRRRFIRPPGSHLKPVIKTPAKCVIMYTVCHLVDSDPPVQGGLPPNSFYCVLVFMVILHSVCYGLCARAPPVSKSDSRTVCFPSGDIISVFPPCFQPLWLKTQAICIPPLFLHILRTKKIISGYASPIHLCI